MTGTIVKVNAKAMTAKVEVYEANRFGGFSPRYYTIAMSDSEEFEELEKVEIDLED